jgi:hypothetical protein
MVAGTLVMLSSLLLSLSLYLALPLPQPAVVPLLPLLLDLLLHMLRVDMDLRLDQHLVDEDNNCFTCANAQRLQLTSASLNHVTVQIHQYQIIMKALPFPRMRVLPLRFNKLIGSS